MNPDATLTYTCSVCNEPAEAPMTAECNWCNARYHLNQRNDVEGKDCGHVWVDEQYLALQFACNTCLAGTDREAATIASAANATSATSRTLSASRSGEPRARRYKKRT